MIPCPYTWNLLLRTTADHPGSLQLCSYTSSPMRAVISQLLPSLWIFLRLILIWHPYKSITQIKLVIKELRLNESQDTLVSKLWPNRPSTAEVLNSPFRNFKNCRCLEHFLRPSVSVSWTGAQEPTILINTTHDHNAHHSEAHHFFIHWLTFNDYLLLVQNLDYNSAFFFLV